MDMEIDTNGSTIGAAGRRIENICFNSSMPKSGSEMLQAVLSQHPAVYAGQTSPVLDMLKAMRAARGRSQAYRAMTQPHKWATFCMACCGMVEGFYQPLLTDEKVVVDKGREWNLHMEWALQWAPYARAVCMVRDLRDVVASLERAYRSNGDEVFVSAPPSAGGDGEKAGKPVPFPESTEERIRAYLTTAPPLAPALRGLKEAVKQRLVIPFGDDEKPVPMGHKDSHRPILCIRYEDFCSHPSGWMARIHDHLGLSPAFEEGRGYDFGALPSRPLKTEIPDAFGPFGSHEVRPSVKNHNPKDGFKDVLDEEDEVFIASFAQWYFELFKYV